MNRMLSSMIAALMLGSCTGDPGDPVSTGLSGTVFRGPMQPVCSIDQPCTDEPFSAEFAVYRGTSRVEEFRSDSQGAFSVALAPGSYRIVPDASAPLLQPAAQIKDVEVGSVGMTTVQLSFDTGIR